MSLRNKSIHELRAIAQGFDVPNLFGMTQDQLVQAIEIKRNAMVPDPVINIPKPEYDARLMTRPPAKMCTVESAVALLQPYIDKGLHLDFPEPERWHMRHGVKEDTGNLRMPLRVLLECADRIMK